MIERIIEWSGRNAFLVLLGVTFALGAGFWAVQKVPLDAIPDLSDVQVIVYTEWPGRSPTLMEDQITYPIVTSLIAAPRVKYVRGLSDFGFSYVYIVFEDGTDLYWARSRVLEYMSKIQGKLPGGVNPSLGPDATGVGWVFEYALVDETGRQDLSQIRSFQDWHLKYWLESVPGVAEVASIGGFSKRYLVDVDPNKLSAYHLPLSHLTEAIEKSNRDVGGSSIEVGGTEFMVRGRGYIRSIEDLENTVVGTDGKGAPILVRHVANVHLGPDMRRGIAELDGRGQVVGGIVIMRYGENALNVINRIKAKLEEIGPSLPEGIKVVPVYDRSRLIQKSVSTLTEKLVEEIIVVSLIVVAFLFHFRSALVVILLLPVAILISFIPMVYLNVTSNIMSLGGIAIAIGAMVDAAIVMVENAHRRLEAEGDRREAGGRRQVIMDAAKELGKPLFFSLLIITISFLPVFTLEAQEGRLFRPLAYTKTFSLFFASVLSITLVPVLMLYLIRGRIRPEAANPLNRWLKAAYDPAVRWILRYRKPTVVAAAAIVLITMVPYLRLGSEFMPPLNEGTLLYMPTTLPGISITEAERVLNLQGQILKTFPEVETVFGKMGRATTPTDPAPLNMVETVVTLKPEDQWRDGLTWDGLIDEMDGKLQIPGMTNIFWMPIQTRTEMLATGVRSKLGIKIFGPDLSTIEELAERIETIVKTIPGTRSAYAERVTGGKYLDITLRREDAARYGLTVGDINAIIESAIGGMTVTTTVEGRERYPVAVRYAWELRDDIERLKRVLVPTPAGAQIPLSQLADIRFVTGPAMITDENGSLQGIVFVDVAGRDLGGYVLEAKRNVAEQIALPAGYRLGWTGQYEYLLRARERLQIVVPLTLLIIFVLLYLNFRSVPKTLIVLLSVPFSTVGAIWILWALDYNLSVAVWIGIIALAGVATEIGVVMITYLDQAFERHQSEGRRFTVRDYLDAVVEGATLRVRPVMMTVAAIIGSLLPILWTQGTGADVMKRIAAPMVGGMITTTFLALFVIPA
ncbi:MAG: CusA/CzcA family heavy metal efflux RND transporter, partial [Nitrospirota bacterium]